MINENFKQLVKIALQSNSSGMGFLPVANVNGYIVYASPVFAFPSSRTSTVSLSATTAGISFGTGTTAATEFDWNLEETIASGITTSITSSGTGLEDTTGKLYLEYVMDVTNSGSESITINEIGYKQSVSAAPYPGSTSLTNYVCLIDRTVFDNPLTIAAGGTETITYRIWTNQEASKTVNNVKIVPWEFGSDEDITAMISAAHAGTIDLQTDAGWRIGMKRPIDIAAFTGGGDTAHAAQTIDLVITSFDDYENCGCVMQVDFDEALAEGQRMEASLTNVNGYDGSEMCKTTLPALVQALPQYLQDMLITFTCKASAGNKSSVIKEATGNKLAIRSVIELKGTNTYSAAGEGSWIPYYKLYSGVKRLGRSGSTSGSWTRSPNVNSAGYFCYLSSSDIIGSAAYANVAFGLAPFACI